MKRLIIALLLFCSLSAHAADTDLRANSVLLWDSALSQYQTLDATWYKARPVGATPTATLTNAAQAGSALTFMRSDGAPALPQALNTTAAPTFGGITVNNMPTIDNAVEGNNILKLVDHGCTIYSRLRQAASGRLLQFATNYDFVAPARDSSSYGTTSFYGYSHSTDSVGGFIVATGPVATGVPVTRFQIDQAGLSTFSAPSVVINGTGTNVISLDDGNASNAERLTLASATGNLWINGSVSVGGTSASPTSTPLDSSGNYLGPSVRVESHQMIVGGQKLGAAQSTPVQFFKITTPANAVGTCSVVVDVMISATINPPVCQHYNVSTGLATYGGLINTSTIFTVPGGKSTFGAGLDISSATFTNASTASPATLILASNVVLSGAVSTGATYNLTYSVTLLWNGFASTPVFTPL